MLKMNRGTARTIEGDNRVIDMEELKKARERRASSARNPYDVPKETKKVYSDKYQERPPFWEQDEEDDKPNARPAAKQKGEHTTVAWEPERRAPRRQARELQREQPRQADRPVRQPEQDQPRQSLPKQSRNQQRQPRAADEPKSRAALYMLLLLLGLLALMVFFGLNIFTIRSIVVKGNDTMTADNVISLSGITKGENIFKVNLGQAKKNLESDPLVEVIGISRSFPDKIVVEVRQRKPHGAIKYLGGYVIIDERGFALDVRDSLPAGQYPLVTGVEIKPCQKGHEVTGIGNDQMQVMKALLTALYDSKAMQYVGEINLTNCEEIKLLSSEGIQIDIGRPTDLPKKAQWIASAIPELRSKGYTSGLLYITGANNPVYSSGTTGNKDKTNNTGAAKNNSTGNANSTADPGNGA